MNDDQQRRTSDPARDERTGRSAAAERIRHQTQWVELQVRGAVERGEFDNLPGYGKPIEGLGTEHDPDWWVKKLVEREQLSVLPPALALRREDAQLDDQLDRLGSEREVRREVEDFNDRVRYTLYSNPGGPPVITRQREVEAEVDRWRSRREERRSARSAERAAWESALERGERHDGQSEAGTTRHGRRTPWLPWRRRS